MTKTPMTPSTAVIPHTHQGRTRRATRAAQETTQRIAVVRSMGASTGTPSPRGPGDRRAMARAMRATVPLATSGCAANHARGPRRRDGVVVTSPL